jgi:hypothetical protein
MNDQLRQTIQNVRVALEADPAGIIVGELRAPNSSVEIPDGPLAGYFGFLAECDGARCGAIDLWSLEELSDNQFRIAHLFAAARQWLCIGQLLYEPLAVERESGELRLFCQGPPPDFRGTEFGTVTQFLIHNVFGPGYPRLIPNPESDRWCALLARLGLLD